MKQINDQSADLPLIEGSEAKAIGDEYEILIGKVSITEEEDERITEILTLAVYHPVVDFWVSNANARAAQNSQSIK